MSVQTEFSVPGSAYSTMTALRTTQSTSMYPSVQHLTVYPSSMTVQRLPSLMMIVSDLLLFLTYSTLAVS